MSYRVILFFLEIVKTFLESVGSGSTQWGPCGSAEVVNVEHLWSQTKRGQSTIPIIRC